MLPRANQDSAITAAAQLACDRVWKGAFADDEARRIISFALVPLFGIRWSKKAIAAMEARTINRRANHLLARAGKSPPRADCDRVADLFKLAYCAPAEFLPEWGEWRTISDRYWLDRRRSRPLLAGDSPQLIAGGQIPFELAFPEAEAAEQLATSFDDRFAVRDFWRECRRNAAKASSADSLFLTPNEVGDNS